MQLVWRPHAYATGKVLHYVPFPCRYLILSPRQIVSNKHQQEYPFSRGWTHINSSDPYEAPDFDAGFMNDKRDMAPMVWGYIKSRETARRMSAYAGEVTGMHPHFTFDSPARAMDMDIATTNAYALPGNTSANIQHGKTDQLEHRI
jgi:alcohol oxidase